MAITKFDSTIFSGAPEFSFLHFKNDFEINFLENTIIFAFNGMCKTTISNYLSNTHSDQFFLINYEKDKEDIKAVKNGKKIEILPDMNAVKEATNDYNEATNNLGIFEKIKERFGYVKTKIPSDFSFLNDIKENNTMDQITLTQEEFNEIDTVLRPIKTIFGMHFKELINLTHKMDEEVKNMQEGLVKDFCEKYLNHLQVNENPNKCPICNGEIQTGLRDLLQNKIHLLAEVIDPYFAEYFCQHTKEENEMFVVNFNNLIRKYNGDEKKLCEYLMIDDYSDINALNVMLSDQQTKKTNLDTAIAQITTIAAGIQNSEPFIKDVFVNKLHFKDAKYDRKKCGLMLTVPDDRPAASYSQGELNLITLITRLTVAKSTDKTNIIIDDPLSSYDLPNQYRIVYEIVKYIRTTTGKKVLIFTHNADALNIAHQYKYGCNFKYFYIEKNNDELAIEPLSININVINIDDIINNNDSEGYLRANRDRENPLFVDGEATKDDLNRIFHYDGGAASCTYNRLSLSNLYLVNKIETFNGSLISDQGFIKNTVTKIIYIMAVRVYVEYKLFHINDDVTSALLQKDEFGNRIREIKEHYLADTKAVYPNFDLDVLISKKVMLNQNEHYKSQVQPYYYAMNLSLDDIKTEIEAIKNLFAI